MREQSFIRNPLTVIAIFAGIAEVSGTVVLPLLETQQQAVFMWFVMGFPCLLVSMFFATLWKKHEVLYAPSDFRDDSAFLEAQRRLAENAARNSKFIEDIEFASGAPEAANPAADIAGTLPSEVDAPASTPALTPTPASPLVQALPPTPAATRMARGNYLLAERAVLNRLQKEFPGQFDKDTVLVSGGEVYAFDATFQGPGFMIGVDVKYFPGVEFNKGLLRSQLSKLDSFYRSLQSDAQRNFKVIMAVATDAPPKDQRLIFDNVEALSKRFSVPIDVRVYDMRILEEELVGH